MSNSAFAGAFALVGLLFAPVGAGLRPTSGDIATPEAPVVRVAMGAVKGQQCQGAFGPTGNGWAFHRDWRACPAAGSEDHPHVSQYLRDGPHWYLELNNSEAGPHDDF